MIQNKIIQQLSKFGIVGITATIVHLSLFASLRSVFFFEEQLSNFIAFACAFIISWSGHYFWTFKSGGTESLFRFLAVALIGYGANSLWVWIFITAYHLPDYYAMAAMVSLTPLMTFILSKFWAFRTS